MLKLAVFVLFLHGAVGLRFLIIGDWGTDDSTQRDVRTAMDTYAASNSVDFILSTGDNFYPDGVSSVDDEQFETKWLDMYNTTNLSSKNWYQSMGNHDHRLSPQAQIDYSQQQSRWILPDYKYTWTSQAGSAKVLFISYDSQAVIQGYPIADEIVEFVRSTLASETNPDTWKFVFAHHPAYSCGRRQPNFVVIDRIISSMRDNNADAYFVGHEHNMQHLKNTDSATNIEHITSGGGGRGTYGFDQDACDSAADSGILLQHFSEVNGFAAVNIQDKTMTVTFINSSGEEIYSFTRNKP